MQHSFKEHNTARLGTKNCTECRRRKVSCVFDDQRRCRQCLTHSLLCESQQVPPSEQSSHDKDRIIQELNQFVTQVESRMVEMQESIRVLTSQLEKCNVAGSADKSPHQQEVHIPEYSQQIPKETLANERSQTPMSQLELIPGDIIPNSQTLDKILDYSDQLLQSLMLWPFAIIHNDQEDRGIFCNRDKIFDALKSRDVGLASKCLIWTSLLLSQLPRDFKDVETGLPLCPEKFIDRILTQVSILYLADCTPACSIDSIEALVLQYELFVAIGRPSTAWKCIRAGIENALLLGLHLRPSLLWDALWIRDRQMSLIIGLPYGTLNMDVQTTELDTLRKIGLVSGFISDRDRLRQDTPFSIMQSIVDGMKELKIMIPDEWAEADLNSAFSPIEHAIMRLYKHKLNIMIHLPYSQFAGYDKQFEYTRVEVLESAKGALDAHGDIRSLQEKPLRCDLYDFLAFNAALVLFVDLVAKETPRTIEEEDHIWTAIMEFVNRLRKTDEVLGSATAGRATDVLEDLYAAYKGRYRGPCKVTTIPYFGRLTISRDLTQTTIELESSVYTFRVPDETGKELIDVWTEIDSSGTYGWRGIYTFHDAPGLPI
ncbi:hypothetical protein HYE68_000879 [Fusarium pseudograminearum]|nr:hypothetical protein HYE68_000879 [Fusarium pseudograminearum]